VTLITSQYRDLPKREQVEGALVIRIPAIRRYKDFCAQWELVTFGLSALIYSLIFTGRHRVDFVQAYFAVPAGWVAWMLNMVRGIPYAVYFGGSDLPGANLSRYKRIYPLITPLLRAIWQRAKFRTVCSEELARLGKIVDPTSEFVVIPNGVEWDRFKPVERPRNKKVKVLFIGRLIPRKGFERVIRSLPEVQKKVHEAFEVEVVGSGEHRKKLDDVAQALGVAEQIKYVGTVPYDELEKSYQQADIFVLTSLSEGMPSVILEAMGCGLPVVASDVGGNNELVSDGWNGYLIRGDDSSKLANDLVQLIDDENLRSEMGQRSREMAKQYNWAEIMRQYNELYLKYDKGLKQ